MNNKWFENLKRKEDKLRSMYGREQGADIAALRERLSAFSEVL